MGCDRSLVELLEVSPDAGTKGTVRREIKNKRGECRKKNKNEIFFT